jgi:hypothetical protein
VGFTALSWLGLASNAATAQQIQTRLPGFQAPASDTLESEILSRISVTGQYQPDDLARLSRLAVLESIATSVNIREDLRGSPLGNRLEEQATLLWDASQVFSDTVSSQAIDVDTMTRARDDFAEAKASLGQLEATLGGLSGVSNRAASHLQAVSRLFDASSVAMGAIESNLPGSGLGPLTEAIDLDALRTHAQNLANELVVLIAKVSDSQSGRAKNQPVLDGLNALASLVRDFARSLVLMPAFTELKQSVRVIRRRLWRLEAAVKASEWPADWQRQWRTVRERANQLSDDFGLPRVIVFAPRDARAAGSDRELIARVDRSIAWVDEYLTAMGPELKKNPAGARFNQDVAKLRRQLLELRRGAAANEPKARLSQRLGAIEVMNQGLAGRARDLERSVDNVISARFKDPSQAVSGLCRAITGP